MQTGMRLTHTMIRALVLCEAGQTGYIAMGTLAAGRDGDPPVVGGESAVAGLAGLLALCKDAGTARRLGLGADARVLLIGTEGDTDPELYTEIVGESGDAVRARQEDK